MSQLHILHLCVLHMRMLACTYSVHQDVTTSGPLAPAVQRKGSCLHNRLNLLSACSFWRTTLPKLVHRYHDHALGITQFTVTAGLLVGALPHMHMRVSLPAHAYPCTLKPRIYHGIDLHPEGHKQQTPALMHVGHMVYKAVQPLGRAANPHGTGPPSVPVSA